MDEDVMRGLGLLGSPDYQNAMGGAGLLGPMPNITQNPVAAPGRNPGTPDEMPMSWADKLKSFVFPTPPGMQGLLSDDDVGRARSRGVMDFGLSMLANAHGQNGGNAPSLGQALQAGVQAGRQGFETANDKTIQGNMTGMQLGQQQHVLQARQAIGKFLTQNMTGDQAKDFAALRQAYMMSAAVGDHEGMKALSPLLEKDPSFTPHPYQVVPAGGKSVLINPRTGQPVAEIPHVPNPVDPSVMEDRAQRLQLLRESALQRGDAQQARMYEQQFQRENALTHDYQEDPDIKSGTKVAQIASTLSGLKAKALAGDPFAQKMALESALRLRNPDANRAPSPADYKMLANSLGLEGKAKRLLENWQDGTVLPAEAMAKLFSTSDQMHASARERYTTARQNYLRRAAGWKIDPGVLNDAFANVAAPAAPSAMNTNPLMVP